MHLSFLSNLHTKPEWVNEYSFNFHSGGDYIDIEINGSIHVRIDLEDEENDYINIEDGMAKDGLSYLYEIMSLRDEIIKIWNSELEHPMEDPETGFITKVFSNHLETAIYDKTIMTSYSPEGYEEAYEEHKRKCIEYSDKLKEEGKYTRYSLIQFLNEKIYLEKLDKPFTWKHRTQNDVFQLKEDVAILGNYITTYEGFDKMTYDSYSFELPF